MQGGLIKTYPEQSRRDSTSKSIFTVCNNFNLCLSNMERIQDGVGDKLGVLIRGISMVIASVVISLIYEWRLALMMLGLIPVSTICMTLLSRVCSFLSPCFTPNYLKPSI